MKNITALFLILLGAALAFGSDNVPNLQQPRYNIYTAGQPNEAGMQEVAALGVKTVINVLPEKDCIPTEPAMVAAKGMVYQTIPFETTGFRMDTVREFAKLLQDSEKPVLIHCSTGNHVGGLWFAFRVLMEKAPVAQALREGRKIGMNAELENSLFNWVLDEQSKLASR